MSFKLLLWIVCDLAQLKTPLFNHGVLLFPENLSFQMSSDQYGPK